jgi:Zn-dependent protease
MFLFEPNRTQFDLNFRLFGINVRVHPLFWLMSAVLGWPWYQAYDFRYLILWIACVFVSVLVHELGHVVVGRWFGSFGHIVLYSFGGLAIGSSDLGSRWRRIAVYFAGPFAQFLILGLVILAQLALSPSADPHSAVPITLKQLWFINLFWPLLNLLPIWPLDGGKISRELFDWIMPERGVATSLVVSIVTAGLLALTTLVPENSIPVLWFFSGQTYLGLFFALFAVNNFFELQDLRINRRRPWERPDEPW